LLPALWLPLPSPS
jgi:carbohydrate ABC transporter membrane protein 2, CUT1 family (TC 3.A.1.1.-)